MQSISQEDVLLCASTAECAAKHLRRTPDQHYLQLLDDIRPKLIPTFTYLNGVEQAAYAVNLWRYGLRRGLQAECLDMLISSRAASGKYPLRLTMDACTAIGVLSKRLAIYDQSVRYLDLAWKIALKLESPCDKAFIRHQLGLLHSRMGHLDVALEHYHASLSIGYQQNDIWILGVVHNELGVMELFKRNFEEAQRLLHKANEFFDEVKDEVRKAETLDNLAIVAGELGQFDVAEAVHRERMLSCSVLKDPEDYVKSLHNLGDICIYTGKFEEALEHLKTSFQEMLAIGIVSQIPLLVCSLGQLCYKRDDHLNAIRLFSYSDRLHSRSGCKTIASQSHDAEESLKALRACLRPNTFSMCWEEGQHFTPASVAKIFN